MIEMDRSVAARPPPTFHSRCPKYPPATNTDACSFFCLRPDQCINSIDRGLLNEGLLDEASASPRIRVLFQHKVQFIDFDSKSLTLRDVEKGEDLSVSFDFCVGADGSYSIVRRQMMKVVRFALFRYD